MALSKLHIDYGDFLLGEKLKKDGSNFLEWHRSLRESLDKVGFKHVLSLDLDEEPSIFADLNTVERFHARFDMIEDVSKTMKSMMCREIRIKVFSTFLPAEIISDLSDLFIEDIEWNKNRVMMELFQLRMEEGTDLESHLARVTSIVDCLSIQLDCFVEHSTLIYAVLATLAPSYQKNVDSLVKGGVDSIQIDKLMDMIRAMVPEVDEPDIID